MLTTRQRDRQSAGIKHMEMETVNAEAMETFLILRGWVAYAYPNNYFTSRTRKMKIWVPKIGTQYGYELTPAYFESIGAYYHHRCCYDITGCELWKW